jgi:hypothetical protein
MYVESLYEARRCVTDKDIWFGIYIENLSGKKYIVEREEIALEMKQKGKWAKIEFKHINAGSISPWEVGGCQVFLREPLAAGRYRIRLPIHIFTVPMESYMGQPGSIEFAYEFDVLAYADAPEPKWEASRLKPSPYDDAKQSPDVKMSFADSVIDKDNATLEILLTADKFYSYGEPYELEVLLGAKWYRAPFGGSMGFALPAYYVGPNAENQKAMCACDPVFACGILPAGKYRIIKEFSLEDADSEGVHARLANEIAIAEFTVEETLGSELAYIEMLSEVEYE